MEIAEMRKSHCRNILEFKKIYQKLSKNDFCEDIKIMKKVLPYMSTAVIEKGIHLINNFPQDKLEGFSLEEISLIKNYHDRKN